MEWAWVEDGVRDDDGKSRSSMSELDKELEKIKQKRREEMLKKLQKGRRWSNECKDRDSSSR